MSTRDWPDPDEVRKALSAGWPTQDGLCTVAAAARAYLRMREEMERERPELWTDEPALSIEQVIAACDAAWGYETGKYSLYIEPEGEGYREAPIVKYGPGVFECEDTITASLKKMWTEAIAKIKERRAADAAKLKELGVEP